jgi:hypothetical protein
MLRSGVWLFELVLQLLLFPSTSVFPIATSRLGLPVLALLLLLA